MQELAQRELVTFVKAVSCRHGVRLLGRRGARVLVAAVLRSTYFLGGDAVAPAVLTASRRVSAQLIRNQHVRARRRGLYFTLNLDDNAQRTLYFTGWYERQFIEWLLSALPSDGVYVDIGAHIGIGSLPAAAAMSRARGEGAVVAIEPTRDSAAMLRAAASSNNLRNVIILEVALAESEGLAHVKAIGSSDDPGMRSVFNSGPIVESVHQRTADAALSELSLRRIDIVKIDVEGAELKVLQGMTSTLLRYRPAFVVVEVTPFRLQQAGVDEKHIDLQLERVGYARSGMVFLDNVVYSRTEVGITNSLQPSGLS